MDPATALTVAGIGLLGVLIGGIITAGANFVIAIRKERADRALALEKKQTEDAKEEQTRRSDVTRAARMIWWELAAAGALLGEAADAENWARDPDQITQDIWKEYGRIIAVELTDAEWSTTALAYGTLSVLQADLRRKGVSAPLEKATIEEIQKCVNDLENAQRVIRSYAGRL